MFISIGQQAAQEDLVGLLLECHKRIRAFIRLAAEVGARTDLPTPEIIEACQRCERYFSEGLRLHVQDEELSVLPRLKGAKPNVAQALQTMKAQHEAHGAPIARLLSALRVLQEDPNNEAERRRLREVATHLTTEFEEHLTLEENVIFPAIRQCMPAEEQATAITELRARRQ